MRLLQWPHVGVGASDPIEFASKIEGFLAGPGQLHHVQVFLRPAVALDFRREIAVAVLLGIGLAGDDVQRATATRQLIEGRDLARHQGRRHEARPVGDEELQLLGPGRCMQSDQEALRRRRGIADERHIEARGLMGLCE